MVAPLVFLFPGQSSRHAGLLEAARAVGGARADAILGRASELLGRDLAAQYGAPGDAPFARNRDVQVGVFVANHLRLAALEAAGVSASLSLGLSLGEYNHLVHIGALAFDDALRLVDARGAAYDAGPDGVMAAVFPIELEELEGFVARARSVGVVEIANLNSPTQHVLSGERGAVEAALDLLEDEAGVLGRVIETRVPMHCSRFAPVAEVFRAALAAAPWRAPRLPYLPNVTAAWEPTPAPSRFVELLARHVHEPVRWRASIDRVAEAHPDATFVEVGPGSVLSDLLRRSWPSLSRHRTDGPDEFAATVRALAERPVTVVA